MARKEDLPALASADRIVIRTAPWAGAKEVTITDAAVLKQLRSALTVKHISPSGGKTWATLTWMNVDKKLREVWVFKYGEWGFERPSTSWTIGRNAELVAIIRKALTEVDGGRVDKSDSDNGS
jgi:hypothetical protein